MPNEILDAEVVDDAVASQGPKYNKDAEFLGMDDTAASDNDDKILDTDDEIKVDKPKTVDDEESEEVGKELVLATEKDQDEQKLLVPFDLPSFGEIKAKYPDIVKDFPGLRGYFYQAAEYSKIFPSVEDAKEALEDNEAFIALRESVISGDSESFIDALKTQSDDSVALFGYNFLCKVSEKDGKAYSKIITPLFENLVRHVYNSSNDENVKNAAMVFSAALWGTTEVAEGKKTFTQKIEAPKKNDDTESFNKCLNEVSTKTNNALGVIISNGLDPDNSLTPFLKKSIVNSCIEEIWTHLAKDPEHNSVMKARWNRAKLNGFTEDDKTKIISTLLVRAKTLIPSIRTKLKNDALGITKKASDEKIKKIESTISRKEVSGGGSGRSSKSDSTPKNGKADYRKMSDLDILNDD